MSHSKRVTTYLRAVLFLAVSATVPPLQADVAVEYIGHSSFVLESPSGLRVVIDPFSSTRWLGYRYPDSVVAHAVLITHPHYDHDASYYWGQSVPVFREPGEYRFDDVTFTGIEGRHADPYGKDFEQKNTIWIVETGGLRFVHLGDNGPLTESDIRKIGRVDVLMIPVDGDEHILKDDAIEAIRRELKPSIVIPMHFRLKGLRGLPESLGPIDPWLDRQTNVVRVRGNRTRLQKTAGDKSRVMLFQPSPDLVAWSDALAIGWQKLDEARELMGQGGEALQQAAALVREAHETGGSIVFTFQWARVLAVSKPSEAIALLESALARAGRDDWEYRMRAHALLGDLYAKDGRAAAAADQFRLVLGNSYRAELRDRAREFLEAHRQTSP